MESFSTNELVKLVDLIYFHLYYLKFTIKQTYQTEEAEAKNWGDESNKSDVLIREAVWPVKSSSVETWLEESSVLDIQLLIPS